MQKNGLWNKRLRDIHCRIRPLLKETKKNFLDCLDFFFEEWRRIWPVSFSIILHEMLLNYFWRYFFKGSLVEIFAKKVAKGNSVQNDPNFPAKSLSIYTKNFSRHLVIDSIENYLINQLIIKENMKLLWITECILRDNKSWRKNR